MAANAVRWALDEVVQKMAELAEPEEETFDDVLARQPGPLETGELGFTFHPVDEED